MTTNNRKATWEGGYIYTDKRGRDIYVIRRSMGGKRYEVSTQCTIESAAFKALARFEADPDGFQAGTPGATKAKLLLNQETIGLFLKWSLADQENTEKWCNEQRRLLAWWSEKLKNVDLRKVTMKDHIVPALDNTPGRHHRIAVIKCLYAWLREVRHSIEPKDDPTFGRLKVPQSDPSKRRIKDKSFPVEHFLMARAKATARWADVMTLQAGTGWHITETMRFASAGEFEPYPAHAPKMADVAGVLVCPRSKAGNTLRTAVSTEVLAAAKRVRAQGGFSQEHYGRGLRLACALASAEIAREYAAAKKSEAPPVIDFTPGRFRHAVATFALVSGTDIKTVSTFLNHQAQQTTKGFYATHAVPEKVPTFV